MAVKVLHTSLLNTTVVVFKVLPLGSYSLMPAPSPPFKTILELVLWNGLQSCHCITPGAINVIKMPSFQYFLYLREQKKVIGARSGEQAGRSNTVTTRNLMILCCPNSSSDILAAAHQNTRRQ